MAARGQVPEGKYTSTVYTWIMEGRYQDVIDLLTMQLQYTPDNRAALSLLGYAHFQAGSFDQAATMYRRLSDIYPDVEEYQIYHAQSLYKAEMFPEALKAAAAVKGARDKVNLLQVAIKYEQGELSAAKQLLDRLGEDEGHVMLNQACILYKEGKFDQACKRFQDAANALGNKPQLSYNIAVCHFKLKQYGEALRHIADIIERGVREHPELNVGGYIEDADARSVGNTRALRESALVEAFNLKAAIEYVMKNYDVAREALKDMPPRAEEELDTVSLHNLALLNMDTNPTEGFKKLNYLLSLPASPPETFSNLLLLYCKPTHAFYDLAADVMAEYEARIDQTLSEDLREFLNASITKQSSAEEAYRKFDTLAQRYVEKLRRLTKAIGEARSERNNDKLSAAISQYDATLEAYVPVVMAMAHIYWDAENYGQVMTILKQSMDLCSDHDTWRLNVAHTLFMEKNYKDALRYYEQAVRERSTDSILDVTAMVLANQCVAHIMMYQNEQAEEVMKRIERDENKAMLADPDKPPFHRCIVKLVIGTLYCANHNYEFGVGCVIKALEPLDKKLSTDTWFHAKRCLVAMIELVSKHILIVEDKTYADVMAFLDECEKLGVKISTTFGGMLEEADRTIASEARMIKQVLMRIRDGY